MATLLLLFILQRQNIFIYLKKTYRFIFNYTSIFVHDSYPIRYYYMFVIYYFEKRLTVFVTGTKHQTMILYMYMYMYIALYVSHVSLTAIIIKNISVTLIMFETYV